MDTAKNFRRTYLDKNARFFILLNRLEKIFDTIAIEAKTNTLVCFTNINTRLCGAINNTFRGMFFYITVDTFTVGNIELFMRRR